MTRVILVLITRERKTPKYVAKGGMIRMTEASMPKIHSGGESDRGGGSGGGDGVNWVELVGAVTSVEHHPRASILNRKTTVVKFNGHRIFTCKRTNGNEIFDKIRRNKNIRHGYRGGVRRKICMSNMGDRKRRTITDGDAVGGVDRVSSMEVTGVRRHVSGGAAIHVPVAAAGVAGRGRSVVESRQQSRVPRCRWERRRGHQGQQRWPTWRRLLTVGCRVGMRRGVVRLV